MAIGNTLLKITLLSTGVIFIFIAILVSFSFPHSLTASFDFPTLRLGVQAALRPPYLYFIINAIIVTIVFTSRFQNHKRDHQHDVIALLPSDRFSPYDAVSVTEVRSGSYGGVVSVEDVDVEVNERGTWTDVIPPVMPERQKAVEISPVSSRFAHHRRPAKASPAQGVKALRVAKSRKKQDTLESTWRSITEGRHMPLTRHVMKKSDTWDNDGRQIDLLDDSFPDPPVKKSDTFKNRTNYSPSHVPKLKKHPSLGQDELNRRAEAFINKVNADMKLQREQSIQQFMEKINRGV